MPASRDTLLRLVRTTPVPAVGTPKVVGIDDFAFRRGRRFGTAVVDLEQHRLLELLPDRSVETVAPWLARYPSVQVVARDRSETYAAASAQGAPQALQVVDRFHIRKNLGEALERFLLTKGSCLRQVTLAPSGDGSPTAPPEEVPHALYVEVGQGTALLVSPRCSAPPARAAVEAALRANAAVKGVGRTSFGTVPAFAILFDTERIDGQRLADVARVALEGSPGSPGAVSVQVLRAPG